MRPTEIIFEVTEAPEGGYDARSLRYSIFTQGEDWNDLKAMVRDAVLCHFDEDTIPRVIRRLVREEGMQSGPATRRLAIGGSSCAPCRP